MPTARTVLLADADVLIDYRESESGILELVAVHVGLVAVLTPVLAEVRGVRAAGGCARVYSRSPSGASLATRPIPRR